MSDLTDNTNLNHDYLTLGLTLSEQFSVLEGKRPRILVGGTIDPVLGSMKEICNSLADMGCDVDLSPQVKTLNDLINQSLENDIDVMLICSDDCFSVEELLGFQDQILLEQPYVIMSLYSENIDCISNLQGHLDQWMLFAPNNNPYQLGYDLLNKLLMSS